MRVMGLVFGISFLTACGSPSVEESGSSEILGASGYSVYLPGTLESGEKHTVSVINGDCTLYFRNKSDRKPVKIGFYGLGVIEAYSAEGNRWIMFSNANLEVALQISWAVLSAEAGDGSVKEKVIQCLQASRFLDKEFRPKSDTLRALL